MYCLWSVNVHTSENFANNLVAQKRETEGVVRAIFHLMFEVYLKISWGLVLLVPIGVVTTMTMSTRSTFNIARKRRVEILMTIGTDDVFRFLVSAFDI